MIIIIDVLLSQIRVTNTCQMRLWLWQQWHWFIYMFDMILQSLLYRDVYKTFPIVYKANFWREFGILLLREWVRFAWRTLHLFQSQFRLKEHIGFTCDTCLWLIIVWPRNLIRIFCWFIEYNARIPDLILLIRNTSLVFLNLLLLS